MNLRHLKASYESHLPFEHTAIVIDLSKAAVTDTSVMKGLTGYSHSISKSKMLNPFKHKIQSINGVAVVIWAKFDSKKNAITGNKVFTEEWQPLIEEVLGKPPWIDYRSDGFVVTGVNYSGSGTVDVFVLNSKNAKKHGRKRLSKVNNELRNTGIKHILMILPSKPEKVATLARMVSTATSDLDSVDSVIMF